MLDMLEAVGAYALNSRLPGDNHTYYEGDRPCSSLDYVVVPEALFVGGAAAAVGVF